jgi:hypothetical protein
MSEQNGFWRLLHAIVDEIKRLIDPGQPTAQRLNAIFGVIGAAVVVMLFAGSVVKEVLNWVAELFGSKPSDSDLWVALLALLALLLFFTASVIITSRQAPPGDVPRNR